MIHWLDDTRLELDGLRFRLDMSAERPADASGDEIVLMKRADLVNAYVEALRPYRDCNVVELGVWEGGSTLFLERLLRPRKLVAIDFATQVPAALASRIAARGLAGTIVPCFGVDQADTSAIRAILEREFGAEPIDVVIDDASHSYAPTRASFNEIFPRLRPGGVYFLEDWAWAHWKGRFQEQWPDEPALTNLVFELTMLLATFSGYMVSRLDVQSGFVAVERGAGRLPARFDVSSLYLARGRRFQPI